MSVSYAVDFASLLLLGPNETMIVAAASAFSQCTFRIKERNPIHRTLFSMACLVVTVQAAGCGLPLAGRQARRINALDAWPSRWSAPRRRTSSFNTLTVATAIALSIRQPLLKVWNENFLWSAPSYFVGAGAARAGDGLGLRACGTSGSRRCALSRRWSLTYRATRSISGRVEDEQRHAQGDGGPASGDDRSAGAGDRREGSDLAVAHPPRPALRGGARARRWA